MIISENPKPSLTEFKRLMAATDQFLNQDASVREDYYAGRSGHPLERDVFNAVTECAKGTPFQDSIQLVSGSSFPDIIANKYYGIEVKSTKQNHWTSIGSSILESTRIQDVERIFLTFGKLGKPVRFLTRPYEECLSGIAVTHYPRYQIDMRLGEGETIFDKIGIPYDELRKMDNPVAPVSAYYRSRLKPGERLWWTANHTESNTPATLRLWSTLSAGEKDELVGQGYALFPEIIAGRYNRFSLWLVTDKGVVNPHVRDSFSAGGQVTMMTSNGVEARMPATFGRIYRYRHIIADTLHNTDVDVLLEHWEYLDSPRNWVREWCQRAALFSKADPYLALDVLYSIFNIT